MCFINVLAPKRVQRNFIKENIRNAKGCAQCIAERRAAEATSPTRSDVREYNFFNHLVLKT